MYSFELPSYDERGEIAFVGPPTRLSVRTDFTQASRIRGRGIPQIGVAGAALRPCRRHLEVVILCAISSRTPLDQVKTLDDP